MPTHSMYNVVTLYNCDVLYRFSALDRPAYTEPLSTESLFTVLNLVHRTQDILIPHCLYAYCLSYGHHWPCAPCTYLHL